MLAYHLVQYQKKSFKVHCFTKEEYRPKQKQVVARLRYKLGYYAVFLAVCFVEFLYAAGNLILYNVFGFTVDLPYL